MNTDWSWKPDYDTNVKLSKKQKKKRENRRANMSKKRMAVIKHFGLDDKSSWAAIAQMICQERGREIPGTKVACKKLVLRYKPNQPKRKYQPRKPAQDFYSSKAWKELRYIALKQSGGCCTLCGARACDGVSLHVDHITPRSVDPSKELDINNLQILCQDCNVGKSNRDGIDWRYPHIGVVE